MVKCLLCKRDAKILVDYNNVNLCERCFKRLTLKRIKRTVREHQMFDSKNIGIVFNQSPSYSLCKYFLEDSKKKHMIDYKILKSKEVDSLAKEAKTKKIDTVVLPINSDEEGENIIASFLLNELEIKMSGADFKYKGLRFVKPIIEIPQKEVEMFLKLKKIKYEDKNEMDEFEKDIHHFLGEIGKRRKAVNFSIVKAVEKIKLSE